MVTGEGLDGAASPAALKEIGNIAGSMRRMPIFLPRMRAFFERRLGFLRNDQSLAIEQETASTLALRNGRVLVVFDRLSRAVTQRGKMIATFGTIQHVHVRKDSGGDGADLWLVCLQLAGSREVVVARTGDSTTASMAAARIAAITGRAVV
jgi:hypothetical protein